MGCSGSRTVNPAASAAAPAGAPAKGEAAAARSDAQAAPRVPEDPKRAAEAEAGQRGAEGSGNAPSNSAQSSTATPSSPKKADSAPGPESDPAGGIADPEALPLMGRQERTPSFRMHSPGRMVVTDSSAVTRSTTNLTPSRRSNASNSSHASAQGGGAKAAVVATGPAAGANTDTKEGAGAAGAAGAGAAGAAGAGAAGAAGAGAAAPGAAAVDAAPASAAPAPGDTPAAAEAAPAGAGAGAGAGADPPARSAPATSVPIVSAPSSGGLMFGTDAAPAPATNEGKKPVKRRSFVDVMLGRNKDGDAKSDAKSDSRSRASRSDAGDGSDEEEEEEGVSELPSVPPPAMRGRVNRYQSDMGMMSAGAARSRSTSQLPGAVAGPKPAAHSRLVRRNTVETPTVTQGREEGHKTVNQYVLFEVLGKGAFGKVKRCFNKLDRHIYAVKIMKKSILKRKRIGRFGNALQNVQKEVAIWKKLNHANVVHLYEVVDDPEAEKLYLFSEFVAGGAIMPDEAVCEPIDESMARRYMCHLIDGLSYLHFEKIIHRDIKPGNLLVSNERTLKIADFGISNAFEGDDDNFRNTAGTAAFMAPEMTTGDSFSGRKIDMWACGITLFMMLHGRTPFMAPTLPQIYEQIRTKEITFADHISEAARDMVNRLLTRDPETRPGCEDLRSHPWLTGTGGVKLHALPDAPMERDDLTEGELMNSITQIHKIQAIVAAKRASVIMITGARMRLAQSIKQVAASQWFFASLEKDKTSHGASGRHMLSAIKSINELPWFFIPATDDGAEDDKPKLNPLDLMYPIDPVTGKSTRPDDVGHDEDAAMDAAIEAADEVARKTTVGETAAASASGHDLKAGLKEEAKAKAEAEAGAGAAEGKGADEPKAEAGAGAGADAAAATAAGGASGGAGAVSAGDGGAVTAGADGAS